MLVLSRKLNESVVIGSGAAAVKVVIVEVRGHVVRLGIDGPREIPVHRSEILEKIQAAKEAQVD